MSDVTHGLCTFHLMQNALKHLGYLYKGNSTFGSDFKACIFGYEDENDLVKAWKSLIIKYNLEENTWMKKTWELREKWAHVYMKWSFNADKRCNESYATNQSRQKLPRIKIKSCPMLVQTAKLYTPPIFDLFHGEFDKFLSCQVRKCCELEGEIKYVIGLYGEDREYIVMGAMEFDNLGGKMLQNVRCTCRKFESFEILCGYAIKVLHQMNVMEISDRYILVRWRLDAKDCSSKDKKVIVNEVDPKFVISACYRHLCPRMVKLAARSFEYDTVYEFVDNSIYDLCVKVDNMIISQNSSNVSSSGGSIDIGLNDIDPNFERDKGLKKKDNVQKSGDRLKPWHEKIGKRTTVVSRPSITQNIDQCNNNIDVQNSSSNQPHDVHTPYWSQMMNFGYNLLTHDVNCPPSHPQSVLLSSQVSYSPSISQEISVDPTMQTPIESSSCLDKDEFVNFSSNAQPPPQN
ncbi:protein FAR1-RELATED SEQUENCE 9-like [Camellia sinensis]|uniref:protein FAR1-RELATED SEQUENCE 9-like n=1 Tax=Camellia sinensis TaxID=4442 RepID=UPI0010361E56|nr:protein FAR1-RELATED SEQUENCE 9-like [Camellia sinensis]